MRSLKHSGFTLLEILIALIIFAIIGVVAAMSLHDMLNAHKKIDMQENRLSQLAITMVMMRRDIAEIINRPVFDVLGHRQAAVTTNQLQGGLVFTRTGIVNPLQLSQRSTMQRVGYVLQDNKLYRFTWPRLDMPPRGRPMKKQLLAGVSTLQWQFVSLAGKTANVWPIGAISTLPKAILMVMRVKGFGVIQGVFPVPAQGHVGGVGE